MTEAQHQLGEDLPVPGPAPQLIDAAFIDGDDDQVGAQNRLLSQTFPNGKFAIFKGQGKSRQQGWVPEIAEGTQNQGEEKGEWPKPILKTFDITLP
ncbi:hypothetical protein JCM30471_06140 [Desulfuromonas carbonis]